MAFGRYLVKRVIILFIILFIIVNIQFFLFQVVNPIDPVPFFISIDFTPEVREVLRQLYGLDQPLWKRYFIYIWNLYTFKFGVSFVSRRWVIDDIMTYLPNTLYLLGLAFVLELVIGTILGLFAAEKRGSKLDIAIVSIGLIAWAVPALILQLTFRFIFSSWLRWFPFGMMTSNPPPTALLDYLCDLLYHTALPLITLVFGGFGIQAFYTRNLLIDVMTQDYILTARAKGVKERTIVYKHAFRVILPPIITRIFISLPGLIMGSIITEYIFTWPGIGWWLIKSELSADYPAIQALFFIYSILILLANFIADLTYGYLDPRIRVGTRR